MRRGGGIGFIIVILAMAIVLILAMKSWLSVAPTAKEIMNINSSAGAEGKAGVRGKTATRGNGTPDTARRPGYYVPAHGQDGAAAEERRGVLPDLSDMKEATDQHAAEVKQAADETNR